MVTVVAFDLMDTLVRDPYREALVAGTGLSLEEIFVGRDLTAYPAFERGELTEDEYWATYAEAGVPVDTEAFHRARRGGYGWIKGMHNLATDVAASVRTVVASNYTAWIQDLAEGLLDGIIDETIASYQLGARKPDEDFYLRLSERLATSPDEVLLIDDRQANVDGAAAVGMDGILFTTAKELRVELVTRGVLV